MAEPRTFRMYAMFHEHLVPLMVACGVFNGIALVLSAASGWWPPTGPFVTVILLVHVAQMAWLVGLRFDDDAITIIRPWRRRRIEWSRINGLAITGTGLAGGSVSGGATNGWPSHHLRLVLDGAEAVSSMTKAEVHALGPVVTAVSVEVLDRTEKAWSWEVDRWDDVIQEFARHGVTALPRRVWVRRVR